MSARDTPKMTPAASVYAELAGGVARLRDKLDAAASKLEEVRAEAEATVASLRVEVDAMSVALSKLEANISSAAPVAVIAMVEEVQAAAGPVEKADVAPEPAESADEPQPGQKSDIATERAESADVELATDSAESAEAQPGPGGKAKEAEEPQKTAVTDTEVVTDSADTTEASPETAEKAQVASEQGGKADAEPGLAEKPGVPAKHAAAAETAKKAGLAAETAEKAGLPAEPVERADVDAATEPADKADVTEVADSVENSVDDVAAAMLIDLELDASTVPAVSASARAAHATIAGHSVDKATQPSVPPAFEAILQQEFSEYFEPADLPVSELAGSAECHPQSGEQSKSVADEWA
jgi:hypothetical protein